MALRDSKLDRRVWTEPPPDENEDANWQAIEARLDAPPRARRWWIPTAVVAAAAAVVVTLNLPRTSPSWAGTMLVAGSAPVQARLDDGSEIFAEPSTVLVRSEDDVPGEDVNLRLEQGSATFEVARNEARTFVVRAADVEVRVVGTRFRVTRDPRVRVDVERGAVDVRIGEETRRLRAGEHWIAPDEREAAVHEGEGPSETQAETEAPPVVTRPQPTRPRRPSAGELFDSAREARRTGDAAEAARLYERFLAQHRAHRSAHLAAFELGRLRMDALNDPRGAAEAFQRAARAGSPFREDALARRVQALAAARQRSACRRAAERLREAYPNNTRADASLCD